MPGDISGILAARGDLTREHYRVRWDDEREAIVYPAEDASVGPGHVSTKS